MLSHVGPLVFAVLLVVVFVVDNGVVAGLQLVVTDHMIFSCGQ